MLTDNHDTIHSQLRTTQRQSFGHCRELFQPISRDTLLTEIVLVHLINKHRRDIHPRLMPFSARSKPYRKAI